MAFKFNNLLIASALMGGLLLAPQIRASTYTATRLGSLTDANSSAAGINASGQVVGSTYTSSGIPFSPFTGHAALWQSGSTKAIDLGKIGRGSCLERGYKSVGEV